MRPAAPLCALLSVAARAATQALLSDDADGCAHPPYEARLVSSSPLVVYLEGFVTEAERAHLRAAAADTFGDSAVADASTADGRAVHAVRTSQSASVARDAVVRCIEARALRFQGLLAAGDAQRLEPLQLVRYGAGQHYHYHTDWFTDAVHAAAPLGGNRASSFFAYVHASNASEEEGGGPLRGGGTNFPLLTAPPASRAWCRVLDCDEPWARGVTFRPIAGNAVYWDNLVPGRDGVGDPRTLHAGLPVAGGEKVGLNIWTRQGRVPAAVRGA